MFDTFKNILFGKGTKGGANPLKKDSSAFLVAPEGSEGWTRFGYLDRPRNPEMQEAYARLLRMPKYTPRS